MVLATIRPRPIAPLLRCWTCSAVPLTAKPFRRFCGAAIGHRDLFTLTFFIHRHFLNRLICLQEFRTQAQAEEEVGGSRRKTKREYVL
jgi:hypothetical protein